MSIQSLAPRRRSVIGRAGRLAAIAAALLLLLADGAQAQGFLRRIKDAAKQKAVSAAARAAGNVAQKSGQVADTALSIGVAGTDSASGRAVSAAGSVVDHVQGKLPGAVGGRPPASNPSAATPVVALPPDVQAQAGPHPDIPTTSEGMPPIPLHGAVFVGRADTLGTASIAYLRTLAQSLREMGNSFVVVATVSPSGDRARDQVRADRRAAAVKAALVAGGATTVTITTAGHVEVPARNAPAGGVTLVKQS